MVMFTPPPGQGWSSLQGGGSQALSFRFRGPPGGFGNGALSAASGTYSTRSPRRRSADLKGRLRKLLERFPWKVACTAGTLSLTGDTIAQLGDRYKKQRAIEDANGRGEPVRPEAIAEANVWNHDFARSLRMGSYGFLLYAPGTQMWYEMLDRVIVGKSLQSISLKVLANQVILGPAIILVVFAWNYFWMGKLKELPAKYKKDMAPSIISGVYSRPGPECLFTLFLCTYLGLPQCRRLS
eukprot:TRINITY_DN338_c0_g1_i3.p1 TRINITY_DN338_c0_g1~~TRINITY_DN338_c0_g1_i3.p1  ORF type:complete len:239 (+),score=19.09 TRINITY_DN338_c0_g1_i3:299-1015(+)